MNQEDLKDAAYAVAKGAIGMIPLAGAPASELLSLLVAPPLEKRRRQWMADIGERLRKLEEAGKIDLELLRENELFVDVVLQATQHAMKSCEEKKVNYFKNVIENTALGDSPERSIAQVYLNLLDRYTVWHIKILTLFDDPEEWFKSHCIQKPAVTMGSLSQVLLAAFPELIDEKSFYDLVWAEMERDGMHKSGSLQGMVTRNGMFASRTTEFGKRFLGFIMSDK